MRLSSRPASHSRFARRVAAILVTSGLVASISLSAAPAGATSRLSVLPMPTPAGVAHAYLKGVSCPTASMCFAVGYSQPSGGASNSTLIERWNGHAWTIVASPNPNATAGGTLAAVACKSPTSCFAVGGANTYGTTGNDPRTTLVERWNGTSWSIVSSPHPANSTLTSISCTTSRNCMAVGSRGYLTLTERWNGSRWSIVNSPNRNPLEGSITGGSGEFFGVSCASAASCSAVGDFVEDARSTATTYAIGTFVLRWNGSAWTNVPSHNPSAYWAASLNSVSCTSPTACVAVGYFQSFDASVVDLLIEKWDGGRWSLVSSPAVAGVSMLDSVSCTSTKNCTAVGFGNNGALVEHFNGSSWSVLANPGGGGAQLDAVSCTGPSCMSVGYTSTGLLAEQYS